MLASLSSVSDFVMVSAPAKITRQQQGEDPQESPGCVFPPAGTQAYQGYTLFLMNCAHCHGSDARGDEGPDLHGVTKSVVRISSLIKNGIKGEMPKFGEKLTDTDVQALIAFVRSLKDT